MFPAYATPSNNTMLFLDSFSNRHITESDLLNFLNIADIDIHTKNIKNQTVLMLASMYNYETLVTFLLKKNVNPNAVDSKKRTALMFAAGQGNVANVKALLSAGAKTNLKDVYGKTALDYAKVHIADLSSPRKVDAPDKNDTQEQHQAKHMRYLAKKASLKQGKLSVFAILAAYKDMPE